MGKSTGENLRDFRSYYGLTQAELADCLGVSVRTVQNWELRGLPFNTFKFIRGLFYMAMCAAEDENDDKCLSSAEIKKEACFFLKNILEC